MKYLVSVLFVVQVFISNRSIAQINTERYREDSDSLGISAIADLEITAITGNTDFQFIHLGGRLNYNWGESYTFLVGNGGFGWDEGESIFDQALLHLRNVQFINDVIQAEGFIQTDFNKKRLLTERELIGAGFRFRIFKTDGFKIRLGTTFFYEHENYDVPANSVHGSNLYANRFSTYLTFEYEIKESIKLFLVNYFQPQIGKWEDYRIISDNSLIVGLSSFVDLQVSFNLRFDSRPPESIKNTDTYTKFGFSFKF